MQIKLVLICFVERKYLLQRYDLVSTNPKKSLLFLMTLDKKKGAFPVLSIIGQPVYTNMKEKEQESCDQLFHALSLQCQKDKTFPQTNIKIINLK